MNEQIEGGNGEALTISSATNNKSSASNNTGMTSSQNNLNTLKKVYIALSIDIITPGHLSVIRVARELGEVTVGLLTDEAIATYKDVPLLTYEQRKELIENIKGIKQVIPQDTLDYIPNLKKLKPDYVVHRNEWGTAAQRNAREKIIETLREWGGRLIEPPFMESLTSEQLKESLREISPYNRLGRLRRLIKSKPIVRVLEAHNGITALIAENAREELDNGISKEFDAIWVSSLTDSIAKGKPDIGIIDLTSRIDTVNQILEVSTKPVILDGDNGGPTEHFTFTVRTLERLGVSAIIIEDKIGLKKNSLFGTEVEQMQDTIENFSYKIFEGKKSQRTNDFMIIARIESLILKAGMEDALRRAKAYIEAGADGIMIHSREKDGKEILEFCDKYAMLEKKVPLIAVPSSYSHIPESELMEKGISVVIYANHLLRSAYPAMLKTAQTILRHGRAHECEEYCMPIKEIIRLVPDLK